MAIFGGIDEHPVILEALTLLHDVVNELKGIRQVLDRQQLHNAALIDKLSKGQRETQDVNVIEAIAVVPVKEQHGP